MTELYEGWNVDLWASFQTRNKRPPIISAKWFTGYDSLRASPWDLGMPSFPLDVRYRSFKRSLDKAMKRYNITKV